MSTESLSPSEPVARSLAERMYPSQPASQPAQAEAKTPPMATRIYPEPAAAKAEALPPEVAALREDPARRMFDAERTYAPTGLLTLFEGQANAKDEVRTWSNVLADHEASSQEASTVIDLVRSVRREPPTDEVVDGWGRSTMNELQARYGDRTASVISDAKRLVSRDPRVEQLLYESGLGNHPKVVSMLIEKAASLRAAGRLK